jgi:hypothetical protein
MRCRVQSRCRKGAEVETRCRTGAEVVQSRCRAARRVTFCNFDDFGDTFVEILILKQ